MNPVCYFEIPCVDLGRAMQFYAAVFGYDFERTQIDNNEMALFPFHEDAPNITGALVQGSSYVPGHQGSRIYFRVESLETALEKAIQNGGRELFPPTSIGELGRVAEFEDSEGNCIALHQNK